MIANSSSKCRAQTAAGHRRAMPLLTVLLLAFGVTTAACEEKGIGRMCDVVQAGDGGVNESNSNTSAPECPSGICLRNGEVGAASGDTGGLCSAECSSDKDCEDAETRSKNPASYDKRCRSGFFCGVPQLFGPLCCKKLCICKDGYRTPFAKPPIPTACLKGSTTLACTRRL